jgi:hypothetical protein
VFDVFVLFVVLEALRTVSHTIECLVDRTFVLIVVVEAALVFAVLLVVGRLVLPRVTPVVGELSAEGAGLFQSVVYHDARKRLF